MYEGGGEGEEIGAIDSYFYCELNSDWIIDEEEMVSSLLSSLSLSLLSGLGVDGVYRLFIMVQVCICTYT